MTLSRAEKCCVTANQRFSFYLLSLLWLVASSNVSLANTYYLDPVSGNDSESGTSEQLAWRSFSKVSAQSNDGDTIVLIRFDDSFNDMTWPDRTYRSTSIQQFGFAWSFDRDYRIGRFVNGDYWVAGPVAIVGITPVSTNEGGRVRHGSMINPSPSTNSHGYDTALPNGEYDADLNVAMGVSPEAPLVLSNPCSLVSTESVASSGQRPQIAGAAVLTILDAPAPQGAFRPAYSGSDKSVQHHADQLDYSLLRTLAPVANTPALETVAKYFERPWLDHRGGWLGRYQHPAKNMPDYGREIATQIGIGALMLHLDFSREQKAKLLHRYVQLGIDLYGVLINEGHWNWHNDGGHGGGRKWPILFAGLMLDDSPMKSIGDKSGNYLYQGGYGPGNCPPDYVHFGEDDQTFYVAQFDVDITNGPTFKPDSRDAQQFPYTTADIGLPEWAIRHSTSPQASNKWLPTKYRTVAAPPFNGLALPALLMDAKELWNNNAFFDYTDRYMAFSAPGGAYAGYWRSNSTFTANMWDTYRAQCGPIWPDTSGGHAPRLSSIGDRTVAIGETLTLAIEATDADGDNLTYSASGLPSGAAFSGNTFTWTPTAAQAGNHPVTFRVTDGQFHDSETITITAGDSSEPSNRQPILGAIGNKSISENERLSFSMSASDPDGDAITYSADGLPSGASLSGQSFAWTPTYSQAGVYQVAFGASDGQNQDTETITITVANVNRTPTLTDIGDRSVDEGSPLAFALSADDPDNDPITYSASGLPTGAGLAGGRFSWTPTTSQIGSYEVTFVASDGASQDSETITIYAVGASPDHTAPAVARLNPETDAIQVVLNNLVTVHVTDSGTGVDASSVAIRVDGNLIYQGDVASYTSGTGRCHRSGAWNNYRFIYQPDNDFGFDHTVTVTVDASDRSGNVMNPYTYSFMTEMRAFGSNLTVNNDAQAIDPESHATTVGDGNGNVWAAWHTGAEGSRHLYVAAMAAGANTFAPPTPLAISEADHCNPNMALGADGRLYVVWQDNRRGNWDLFLATSSDGTTWSKPVQVTDSNHNETHPSIAVDRSSPNRIYVAWQDDRNGAADIYVTSSTNVFSDSTIAQVTAHSADQLDPDITVNGENVAYVVWTDARNGQADIYGASGNSGWANVPIVTTSSDQTSPALAADPETSSLHLLWVDNAPGDSDIYYALLDGLQTSPVTGSSIIDDTAGAGQFAPSIVFLDSVRVFACWQDLRHATGSGSDTDLYLTELGSGAAKTNILVGDDGSNANQSEPALGIDGHGNPYVVWTDGRNRQTEIYYAATTFVSPNPLDSKIVVASEGATVGSAPATIDEPDDVSIVVPAGACQCDVRITISEILNPLAMPAECLGSYDFGPSGIDFDEPVTVTIPYRFSGSGSSAKPYWYDSLTGALSQQGITEIKNIVVASNLNALQFKTTHFTPFYLMATEPVSSGGSSSGGGCSVSATGKGSPKEFLAPYSVITLVMILLRRSDRKRRQSFRVTQG